MLKDKYVKVNGVKLHYVTAGKGPLILFLAEFIPRLRVPHPQLSSSLSAEVCFSSLTD